MEAQVDGLNDYTETSGTTLGTTLSVAAGSSQHRTETKWEQVVYTNIAMEGQQLFIGFISLNIRIYCAIPQSW